MATLGPMLLLTSVSRWLHFLFNISPLTTTKCGQKAKNIIAKLVSKVCKVLIESSRNCKSFLSVSKAAKFCQIWSHAVLTVDRKVVLIKQRGGVEFHN